MDRAEATGLGVATVGHAALLAAITYGMATTLTPAPGRDPIEVSFVDEAALVSTSPSPAAEAPPLSATDPGLPEPAMPSPPMAQPVPQPRSQPPPAAPAPRAAPRPAPAKAAPAPPAPAPPKPNRTRRGGPLSINLNNVSDGPSDSRSTNPPAAVMSAQAAASIGALIRRQVQPCADRMVNPGPGASRIKVRINLKLNRNGSLRAPPSVEGVSGLDDENRRYAQRVKEMAVAAFRSCSPLQDLPPELYAVSGGWSDFDMNYNLP
jgi:hypothetical protein